MTTKTQIHNELMHRDPAYFRDQLQIETGLGHVPFGSVIEKFQKDDFDAIDPCLKFIAGYADEPKIKRFFIQRGRGHSKTADMAASITWILWGARKNVLGFAFAEDKDQSKLLRDAMVKWSMYNPWLTDTLEYQKNSVVNKKTGSELKIMSRDMASSWGITPDFTICDEFTHWMQREYWESILSSYAKKTGMLTIMCNAGTGYGWQYSVKEWAMKRKNWHYSAPQGIVASWLNKESLLEQKALLSAAAYNRLWMNIWQESGQEFITLAEAEACRVEEMTMQGKTKNDGWTYVASVDFAEKTDRTVGTVIHGEGDNNIYVDRMDVVCPAVEQKSTRVSWVDDWMRKVDKAFGGEHGNVHFVLDKYQLLGVGQDLIDLGFDIEFYDFGSGLGNWKMGVILRQLIIHQRLLWYPNCASILDDRGRIVETAIGRDDLEMELASLVLKNYSQNRRWRFDHIQDGLHHDDRAYSLGSACQFVIENSGGYEAWDIMTSKNGVLAA